ALLLIRTELRLQVARLLDALDLVDVGELLEEVLRAVGDLDLADLVEQLLDASGLRERELSALPASGGEDLRLALEDFLHLVGVELGERTVREAHVAAALGEAARELLLRDGHAFRVERQTKREPIDAARHARVRSERAAAHLHVDEVVGNEEIPFLGKRSD